jgi:site-specific DNA-methyltransferase (adenine-specific)
VPIVSEGFLNDKIILHCGDMRAVLAELTENSFDACVTDPPYHLTSIVKRMSAENAAPIGFGSDGRYQRVSVGFMGKVWDGGDIAFDPTTWRAVYRVLKPGAHLVAFGGTRTYARMAVAIEDAGFEIRDTIAWLYGSGFPKSHDVSKGLDRMAGAEREVVGQYIAPDGNPRGVDLGIQGGRFAGGQSNYIAEKLMTAPATGAARQWEGWGTALKPAMELIVLARKPLSEGTVAANVLKWGTGAINVDGCRIEHDEDCTPMAAQGQINSMIRQSGRFEATTNLKANGRWPANVGHDGSADVTAAFPESKVSGAARNGRPAVANPDRIGVTNFDAIKGNGTLHNDSGSAARFFFTAKADSDDRLGSRHPTVKPLDLMQWLVRLVTPPRGLLLDPFAGTGTTAEAAFREGMRCELIEAEAEYQADIRRRMALALAGPDERIRESVKARNLPRDDGPLFAAKRGESWSQMWARPFDWSKYHEGEP